MNNNNIHYTILITYHHDPYSTGAIGLFENAAQASNKIVEYLDQNNKHESEPDAFNEFKDGADAYEDSEIRIEVISVNSGYFVNPDETKKPTYVESVDTHHSGGGSMVDLVYLKSGLLLVLNDEAVAVYRNDRAFQLDVEPIGIIETYDAE